MRPMIITRLNNGFGNQLFQYAAGLALAEASGQELIVDARHINGGGTVKTILDHMSPSARHGTPDQLPPEHNNTLRYELWRRLGIGGPRKLIERGLGYNTGFFKKRGEQYLIGYWQSEKYFGGLHERLRQEFTFTTPPSDENARWLERIASGPSLSLHIRRGDYITKARVAKMYGAPTLDYYRNSVKEIAEKTGTTPEIYVFSDDLPWVEENLSLPFHMHYMAQNPGRDASYEDLRLMAACDNHIIANSTFSWWGAWLNPKPDKIVIAPENWFAVKPVPNPDILPESWWKRA